MLHFPQPIKGVMEVQKMLVWLFVHVMEIQYVLA